MANALQATTSRMAIFMVMALSSTAVLAQTAADPAAPAPVATPAAPIVAPAADATTPQDAATPAPAVTMAPIAPAESPAPAATQEPAPVTAPVATTQSAAPVASGPVIGTPVVHMPDADATAEPAAAPRRVTRTSTASTRNDAAPAPVKTANAPTPVTRTTEPAVAPVPAPAAAPVASKTTEVTQVRSTDDTSLELIGLGGAGLLVLGGAAFAFSRRKRQDEQEDAILLSEPAMADPIVEPVYVAPAFAPSVAAPAAASATATTLPSGFDLSRFGRHTRAAYVGPTPENPSLSLRRRLKHASFFDGRERMAGITPVAASPAPAPQTVAASNEQLVFRPGGRTRVGFRPAYQS